jgi:hypothetical protein
VVQWVVPIEAVQRISCRFTWIYYECNSYHMCFRTCSVLLKW